MCVKATSSTSYATYSSIMISLVSFGLKGVSTWLSKIFSFNFFPLQHDANLLWSLIFRSLDHAHKMHSHIYLYLLNMQNEVISAVAYPSWDGHRNKSTMYVVCPISKWTFRRAKTEKAIWCVTRWHMKLINYFSHDLFAFVVERLGLERRSGKKENNNNYSNNYHYEIKKWAEVENWLRSKAGNLILPMRTGGVFIKTFWLTRFWSWTEFMLKLLHAISKWMVEICHEIAMNCA
jgi:hypothetical protein